MLLRPERLSHRFGFGGSRRSEGLLYGKNVLTQRRQLHESEDQKNEF